jgi:outer membrane protein assembly factor BamB
MFHHDVRHTGLSTVDTSLNPGVLKWTFNAHAAFFEVSPVIGSDGSIYLGSSNHTVYALDPTGREKWAFHANNRVDPAPAVGPDGTIYASTEDNTLYALRADGKKKWQAFFGGPVFDPVTVGADGILYVGNAGALYALIDDPANGLTFKWSVFLGGFYLSAPAVGADGTLYVGSDDDNVYAVNTDGTLKWKFTTGATIFSAPTIGRDGTVYIGSEDYNLYALNDEGQGLVTEKWAFATGNQVWATPAIGSDGTVYFGSNDNNLYALTDGGSGAVSEKWAFATGGLVDYGSPAIGAEGTIYLGTDDLHDSRGTLFAINPDGTEKWAAASPAGLGVSAPVIGTDGTIYMGTQNTKFYAFGSPVPVKLKINPTSLDVGVWKVGTILVPGVCDFAAARTKAGFSGGSCITVGNPKGGKLRPGITVRMDGISGVNNPFLVSNGCNGPLAPGAQCAISVGFAPTVVGPQTAHLTILDDAKGAPQTVELHGTGK